MTSRDEKLSRQEVCAVREKISDFDDVVSTATLPKKSHQGKVKLLFLFEVIRSIALYNRVSFLVNKNHP